MTGGRAASRRAGFILWLSIVCGVVVSCGDDSTTPPPPGPEPFFPADFLTTYGEVRDCRGSIEHPAHIRVFANPEAVTAYTDSFFPFAVGTVLVKVAYNNESCTQVLQFDAMRKGVPGTAPASGDWEWQVVNTDRGVRQSGQIASCINCHAQCTEGRDFICTNP